MSDRHRKINPGIIVNETNIGSFVANVSLDPNTSNYIGRMIGDQVQTLRDAGTTDPFLQLSGSFPNRSKYVRVSDVRTTYNYLDANGSLRVADYTASLPAAGSGSS